MSLNFDSAHFQTSFPTWAGVFRVAVAAAVAPVDYVLAGMVAAGLGAEAISLYLGLARTALFERLVELGLPAPHDRPLRRAGGRNSWSTEDVQQLIAWWVAGIHVRSIAVGLGRSRSAIYAKRRRIGLPDRERKRLVYRSLSELAATSGDGGVPPPPDNAAPVHHGVGASVNSLLPPAIDLGSCVGEPVVVTGGALVAPVQGSMFDVFEAALSSKAVSPAGLDQVRRGASAECRGSFATGIYSFFPVRAANRKRIRQITGRGAGAPGGIIGSDRRIAAVLQKDARPRR